jgi:hypothetical protein
VSVRTFPIRENDEMPALWRRVPAEALFGGGSRREDQGGLGQLSFLLGLNLPNISVH